MKNIKAYELLINNADNEARSSKLTLRQVES